MAFLRRVLEHQPVYYLGTDTGQVWRGSPEVGWTKLCECGAAPVNAIGPDLFRNERIFVVLKGPTSPGRIKELDRLANGTWQSKTIDAGFAPDVDVEQLFSVAVDPAVPATQGTTIYVGTDQGVYRGHVDELVFDPSVAALAHIPPILGDWTWRHRACPTCRSQTSRCNKTFRLMTRAESYAPEPTVVGFSSLTEPRPKVPLRSLLWY